MVEALISGFGVIASALVGAFVFLQNPSGRKNLLYGLLSLSFASLIFFNYLTTDPYSRELIFVRMVVVSTTLGGALLFGLVAEIQKRIRSTVLSKYVLLTAITTPVVVVLETSPAVFNSISAPPEAIPSAGWAFFIFVIHFGTLLLASIWLLLNGMKHARLISDRQQYRLIVTGMTPILLLAPVTSVIMPIVFQDTSYIKYSPLYIVFFLAAIGYAIVKHGLFDIKAAAIRTAAYLLSLTTLGFIYFLLAYVLSVTIFKDNNATGISMSPVNIMLALVLAFIFQPVKDFFDKVTDKIFFRDRYDTEEFYSRLSELLAGAIDLRDLMLRASKEIGGTLKAEQTFFYINYDESHHTSAGTAGYSKLAAGDVEIIKENLSAVAGVVVTALLTDSKRLRRTLEKNNIEILKPLYHDGQLLGFLALGPQLSSSYSQRDIKVLETISDELVIAVENALAVQEVRDLNVNLQERINEATKELLTSNKKLTKLDETKDEFISMASHQLRTPLTSVKGYISMVLDGDAGEISKEQRELLEQAFDSSQRMVYLIGDFLNISRLRTGKFVLEPSTVNLANVVGEEISQLRDTAKSRGIAIRFEKPHNIPNITADENKLRQVMMNFMDNAIYYTLPGGDIDVQLYKTARGIVFKVKDSGIGVPKAEQAKLFTKFFRAPNARKQRPDGTGIGLYMAKKVIVAHGGSLLFESKEGKGSTFGFELPLVIDINRFDKAALETQIK